MKKPIDPRAQGLKEPIKFIQKTERVYLDNRPGEKTSLQTFVSAWNKILKEMRDTVIDGPFVKGISEYSNPHLEFTIEYQNPDFEEQKTNFTNEMTLFSKANKAYNLEQEKKTSSKALSLEDQIIWAEAHLAELKAKKEELLSC